MSDLHPMPLLEHDLPNATSFDEPEVRAKVFSRRSLTGLLEWYWRLKVQYSHDKHWTESVLLHGPYLTARDAGKAAEDELEML